MLEEQKAERWQHPSKIKAKILYVHIGFELERQQDAQHCITHKGIWQSTDGPRPLKAFEQLNNGMIWPYWHCKHQPTKKCSLVTSWRTNRRDNNGIRKVSVNLWVQLVWKMAWAGNEAVSGRVSRGKRACAAERVKWSELKAEEMWTFGSERCHPSLEPKVWPTGWMEADGGAILRVGWQCGGNPGPLMPNKKRINSHLYQPLMRFRKTYRKESMISTTVSFLNLNRIPGTAFFFVFSAWEEDFKDLHNEVLPWLATWNI